MEISKLKLLDKEMLMKLLFLKKNIKLDDYEKLSKIYNFDFKNKEYARLEELTKYCLRKNIKILTPFEKDIPKLLQILESEKRDLIFIKGQIIDKDLKSYSICGSRTPTEDAVSKTHLIAEFMAKHDFTLINGFAKGIDIEAFLEAYKQNGRYIGILGSGVENVYPPEHNKYLSMVIRNGALISQNFIWNRVNKTALQIRNRFSAQLTLGSIFIEGNYKSGTIWQYKFAAEMKKSIFYLEPKDWNHPNTHILKIIKNAGGFEIKNDLSNIEIILKILEKEYSNRMETFYS
jgi:DNA processing protein